MNKNCFNLCVFLKFPIISIFIFCMYIMKKLVYTIFLFLGFQSVFAQEQNSFKATGRGGVATTFATDYQAIGVNAANLGIRKNFRDPSFTFGFLETNLFFSSEDLDRNELFHSIFNPKAASIKLGSHEEKKEAAERMTNSKIAANIELTWFGFHYSRPKFGGIAVSMVDRMQLSLFLGKTASEIAFLGYNASYFSSLSLTNGLVIPNNPNVSDIQREQVYLGAVPSDSAQTYAKVLDGTRISSMWFREYNLSYGKKTIDEYNFSLHLGVGYRFISGIALLNIESRNGVLEQNSLSLSPTFGLNFNNDPAIVKAPGFIPADPNASILQQALFAKPVGYGNGFDFGLNMVIRRNLYIGFAINNIGSITWDGNVTSLNKDGKLAQFAAAGLNTYSFFDGSNAFQFGGDESALKIVGVPPIKTELPTVIRAGISYEYFKTFHIGIDIIAPQKRTAGSLNSPIIAIGGDWQINRLIKLSSGFSIGGNTDRLNFPIGFTYTGLRRRYELGASIRDVRTLLIDIKNGGSTLSFSTGFLRFRF